MRSPTLATVLEPCSLERFLAESFGRRPRHVPGSPERFAALWSWDLLDRFLSHGFDPRRVKSTLHADPSDLLDRRPQGSLQGWSSSTPARVSINKLHDFVRSPGAALSVSGVHELDPEIAAFAEHLEDVLGERVEATLFVGFQPRTNVLHADHGDLFVVHLQGRKRWELHAPNRVDPVPCELENRYREAFMAADQARQDGTLDPSGHFARELERAREGEHLTVVLEPGDLLYLPRGWLHEVTSELTPSVHLTFSLEVLTGVDLLRWLADRLCSRGLLRQRVPQRADRATRERYADALRQELTEALMGDPVAALGREQAQRRLRAPAVRLRDHLATTPPSLADRDEATLRWVPREPMDVFVCEALDELSFYERGRLWELCGHAHAGRAIVERLRDASSVTLRELVAVGDEHGAERALVTSFVELLVREGVVAVEEASRTRQPVPAPESVDPPEPLEPPEPCASPSVSTSPALLPWVASPLDASLVPLPSSLLAVASSLPAVSLSPDDEPPDVVLGRSSPGSHAPPCMQHASTDAAQVPSGHR